MYIKNISTKRANEKITDAVLKGEITTPEQQMEITQQFQNEARESLSSLGNQRFFKPSEISDKTWKDLLKDLEWDVEVDITGESTDTQAMMTTLNTALQVVINPAFAQNPKAQFIVDRILTATGTVSPIELASLPQPSPLPMNPNGGSGIEREELAVK
jgi:hypothetical protein